MRTTTLAAALLTLAACGPHEKLPSHVPGAKKPHAEQGVQVWDIGPDLAARKSIVVKTLKDDGATDDRIALVLAAIMGETTDLKASSRDASKDSAGDAKNFSALNMNRYALKKVGWAEGQGIDLNDDRNLGEAVKLFNHGLNLLGEDPWLWLHRGGQAGLESNGVDYGGLQYCQCIRQVQEFIKQDPARFIDGNRYGMFIMHV